MEARFNYIPNKRLRDNVRAVLLRDMAEALALVAEQASLDESPPALQGVYVARAVRDRHPLCNVLVQGGDPAEDPDGNTQERRRFLVEFETVAPNAEELFETIELYVTAGRIALMSAAEEDFTEQVDAGTRGDWRWSIGVERYGEREYEAEDLYTVVGSFVLTIEFMEARKVMPYE